jgi:uncharacterized protein YdeI (BOF family)
MWLRRARPICEHAGVLIVYWKVVRNLQVKETKMKISRIRIDRTKPLGISLATGALIVAPLLIAGSAQADPPMQAPAYGYYRDRPDDRNNSRLSGVVTSVRGNDRFDLRADDGRTYRVDVDRGQTPRDLSNGDRVTVYGRVNGSTIQAANVRVEDNTSNYGRRITLDGVVTNDLRGDQFEFRADNGQVYFVNMERGREPARLSRNDRVTVSGTVRGNTIQADNVRILSNNNNNNNANRVTLNGVVTRDWRGNQFEFRADDGQTYLVEMERGQEPPRLSRNDRVAVFGTVRGNTIQARSVRILDNAEDNSGRRNVNFPGTVVTLRSNSRLTVRGDNGSTYEVISRNRLDTAIRQGDRVRVIGQANGLSVTDADVSLLSNLDVYNRNDNNVNREVNFTGTVESTSITSFRLRGDNGQVYEVRYKGSLLLRRDQRVRVVGTFDGRIIEAANVDNL